MSDQRVPIPGSEPNTSNSTGVKPHWSFAVDPTQKVSVTVTLRRRQSSAAAQMEEQLLSGQAPSIPREQAEQAVSADPRDTAAVRAFLEGYGLTVTDENMASRTLKAEGTVAQMEEAFSARIGSVEDSADHTHLSYQGSLSIPHSLDGIITSIIGLDQRPVARRH